ncbi:optic atrophy 3 protein isoform X1 [Vespula squamosa]|uniref:Optic atrophy 3 protein isoform X1 n=1 Tax=Vespula squamosa TaxID=30214 RepID=A0ABD2ABI2_VESSQ
MVVGVFPALKLGVLFIKQISKPLAKIIVNQAKNHPIFRRYFIIPPAQLYHWAEVKSKMYMMNLGKPTKVAKLNENMAMELGASLMGEVIIFGLAGACVMLEYNRQVTKEAKKEEIRVAQIQQFIHDINLLQESSMQLQSEILSLKNTVAELTKGMKSKVVESSLLTEIDKEIDQSQSTDTTMNLETNVTENQLPLIQRAILYYENNFREDR